MTDHRTRFLDAALRAEALRFGEFTLKSGRSSPYFFNAGRFDSGAALATLGRKSDACAIFARFAQDYPRATDLQKRRIEQERQKNGCG